MLESDRILAAVLLVILAVSWYNSRVNSKLCNVNPYLRDPALRERMVFTSVATSSAIEGVHAPFKTLAPAAVAKPTAGAAASLASDALEPAHAPLLAVGTDDKP